MAKQPTSIMLASLSNGNMINAVIVLGYVKWIFLLSIAVSLYWAENWKRVAGSYPSPFFLRALKQISTKWSSSDAGKLSIFSFFIPLASM